MDGHDGAGLFAGTRFIAFYLQFLPQQGVLLVMKNGRSYPSASGELAVEKSEDKEKTGCRQPARLISAASDPEIPVQKRFEETQCPGGIFRFIRFIRIFPVPAADSGHRFGDQPAARFRAPRPPRQMQRLFEKRFRCKRLIRIDFHAVEIESNIRFGFNERTLLCLFAECLPLFTGEMAAEIFVGEFPQFRQGQFHDSNLLLKKKGPGLKISGPS